MFRRASIAGLYPRLNSFSIPVNFAELITPPRVGTSRLYPISERAQNV